MKAEKKLDEVFILGFISLQENFNFREKKFVENIVMSVFCCIFVCRNTPQYPILLFVCYQEPCGEPWMTTVPVEGRGPSDVQRQAYYHLFV